MRTSSSWVLSLLLDQTDIHRLATTMTSFRSLDHSPFGSTTMTSSLKVAVTTKPLPHLRTRLPPHQQTRLLHPLPTSHPFERDLPPRHHHSRQSIYNQERGRSHLHSTWPWGSGLRRLVVRGQTTRGWSRYSGWERLSQRGTMTQ